MSFLLNARNASSQILQGDIVICITELRHHTTNLDSYWETLSLDEQKHAQKFYFNSLFERYVIAHGILRNLLAIFTGIEATKIQFYHNKYQKPYISNSSIYFNLSYSSSFIAYAFAIGGQVGIDIETKNLTIDVDSMARLALSTQELKYYLTLNFSKKFEYFYTIWTKKEALVKAIGCGLNYNFKEINFGEDEHIEAYTLWDTKLLVPANNPTGVWYASSFQFNPCYYGAIATELPNKKTWYWDLELCCK